MDSTASGPEVLSDKVFRVEVDVGCVLIVVSVWTSVDNVSLSVL